MMAMHSAKRQSVIHVPESVCSLHVYKSKVIVLEYDPITGGPIGSSVGVTLVYRLCTELWKVIASSLWEIGRFIMECYWTVQLCTIKNGF